MPRVVPFFTTKQLYYVTTKQSCVNITVSVWRTVLLIHTHVERSSKYQIVLCCCGQVWYLPSSVWLVYFATLFCNKKNVYLYKHINHGEQYIKHHINLIQIKIKLLLSVKIANDRLQVKINQRRFTSKSIPLYSLNKIIVRNLTNHVLDINSRNISNEHICLSIFFWTK